MAYSDWTLETVKKAFQLEEVNAAGIFADAEPVAPSAHLTTTLERNVPLAFAMGHREGEIRANCLCCFSLSSGSTLTAALVSFLGLTLMLMPKTV